MGRSTFSGPVRAGAKPHLAGSTVLSLGVEAGATGVKGSLPPGSIVLGGVGSENGLVATVGTATITTVTAGTSVEIAPVVQADAAEIEVTSAAADGILYINYLINDPDMGANG